MPGLSALLLGATGATGSLLLQEVLASPVFDRVGEYGRRITRPEKIKVGKGKLEQKVIDYENIEKMGLKEGRWDVIFITLGVSIMLAESKEEFERVDREYVINAARAAKSDDASHRQRIVYVSAMFAHPSSFLQYFRSKAATEIGLAQLGYSDLIVVRPGMFGKVHREVKRPMEVVLSAVFRVGSCVSDQLYVQLPHLVRCLRVVGECGGQSLSPKLVWMRTENGYISERAS
ncbi:hypothetical protein DAEQUDRAFT_139163 [Daedalea quercina L-15889]|uniref:NAD(P)-binding domain-containing protein n=1 Tax=Daedalea quercina L-15889 TaxID=1314783 RepID=A0A165RTK3_9APHY|nr:hypothetical protein DAEQUDRAFT_139163 [Daedalea quercina L-15889]